MSPMPMNASCMLLMYTCNLYIALFDILPCLCNYPQFQKVATLRVLGMIFFHFDIIFLGERVEVFLNIYCLSVLSLISYSYI